MIIVIQFLQCVLSFGFKMSSSDEKPSQVSGEVRASIPVLSENAQSLESHVKTRYVQKISVIRADPNSFPDDQFDPECLPPIEAIDLLGYLETSYYTKEQFKAYKSLEAYIR